MITLHDYKTVTGRQKSDATIRYTGVYNGHRFECSIKHSTVSLNRYNRIQQQDRLETILSTCINACIYTPRHTVTYDRTHHVLRFEDTPDKWMIISDSLLYKDSTPRSCFPRTPHYTTKNRHLRHIESTLNAFMRYMGDTTSDIAHAILAKGILAWTILYYPTYFIESQYKNEKIDVHIRPSRYINRRDVFITIYNKYSEHTIYMGTIPLSIDRMRSKLPGYFFSYEKAIIIGRCINAEMAIEERIFNQSIEEISSYHAKIDAIRAMHTILDPRDTFVP